MTHTSMLHVRVADEIKDKATANLAAVGMSMSSAVRLFLHRIANDQTFPLDLTAIAPPSRPSMPAPIAPRLTPVLPVQPMARPEAKAGLTRIVFGDDAALN